MWGQLLGPDYDSADESIDHGAMELGREAWEAQLEQ